MLRQATEAETPRVNGVRAGAGQGSCDHRVAEISEVRGNFELSIDLASA